MMAEGVNRGIIPMEKPPLLHKDGTLLPQVLHEDIQELHDVRHVDSGALGDDVRVDEALVEQHLFGLAGLDLSLYWARLTLLYPLLELVFLSQECGNTSSSHPW
jgi:hypothetical protein